MAFTNNSIVNSEGKILCDQGYWPPLDYFKELKNLNIDVGDRIPINEMCKRCDNGYHYTNERGNIICKTCDTES